MGGGFSRTTQLEHLVVFRKLPSDVLLDDIEIPESAENRRPTDRIFLLIYFVLLLGLLPFLIYSMMYSDFNRLKGYDQCGNICGKKNVHNGEIPCSGQDLTVNRYLEFNESVDDVWQLTPRACVRKCSDDTLPIYGQCAPHHQFYILVILTVNAYLKFYTWRLIFLCIVSLVVTLGMLFLFKTATTAVVWGILVGISIVNTTILGMVWYFLDHDRYLCVLLTALWFCLISLVINVRNKVQLIIQLFKEATKAIFAMPQLLFIPIFTFCGAIVITVPFCVITAFLLTAGKIHKIQKNFHSYEPDTVMIFAIAYNCWVAFVSWRIVKGIQYMIISGAIAKWYWSKDKNNLNQPIRKSTQICFKYHLGSVVFGSITISLIAIIRVVLKQFGGHEKIKIYMSYFLEGIESFLAFISKNSYIMTAMHGKPFYKSGKRAARIIFQNAVKIAAINFMGDFILFIGQILIVFLSVLITWWIMQGTNEKFIFIGCFIVGIASIIISSFFFSIFETTIDTIFLCFCEDGLLNDGMARPFAMSRDLMEFVENSRKVWIKKIKHLPQNSVIQPTNI